MSAMTSPAPTPAHVASRIADRVYVSPCLGRGDCWFGARRTAIVSARYRF